MSDLTEYESRLLRDPGRDGALFRAGATCEARLRNGDGALHCEMVNYVRALAEAHPDWSDQHILEAALRVFTDGAHALSEAARVELESLTAPATQIPQDGNE